MSRKAQLTTLWVVAIFLLWLAGSSSAPVSAQEETEGQTWLQYPLAREDILAFNQGWGVVNQYNPDGHLGWDLAANVGTKVLAVADGVVVGPSRAAYSNDPYGWGVALWISHGNGVFSFYGHLSQRIAQPGQVVKQGDVVALTGNTGRSTGPHLHFAVSTKHPDAFVNWNDVSPGWVDHTPYLGHFVAGPTEFEGTVQPSMQSSRTDPSIKNEGVEEFFNQWIDRFQTYETVNEAYRDITNWLKNLDPVVMILVITIVVCALVMFFLPMPPRLLVTIVALVYLGLAIYLPTRIQWRETPVANAVVRQEYGSAISNFQGYLGIEYGVSRGTPVAAVAEGTVICPETSLFTEEWGTQVWIDHHNGLFSMYGYLAESRVKCKQSVDTGEAIGSSGNSGNSASDHLFFGVSSKHPDEFGVSDERGWGWRDPREFLGKENFSGVGELEMRLFQLGFALLVVAIFWGDFSKLAWRLLRKLLGKAVGKLLSDTLPYPWGMRTVLRYTTLIMVSSWVLIVGISSISPYYKVLGGIPTGAAVLYFLWRAKERQRILQGRKPWLVDRPWDILTYKVFRTAWVTATAIWILAGVFSPKTMIYAEREYSFNFPKIVVEGLSWSPRSEENPSSPPPQSWSTTSALPEFSITYWNGGTARFYAPAEVWDAVVAASEEFNVDPYLIIAIAHSESPVYNNTVCSPVGACGVWQFMPGTWLTYSNASISERHNVREAARAAAQMVKALRFEQQTTRNAFVARFAGLDGGLVWNAHEPQADYVWRLWQELRTRTDER